MQNIRDKQLKKQKIEELDKVIHAAAGLYMELIANDFSATPGSSIEATLAVINRASANVTLLRIETPGQQIALNKKLPLNEEVRETLTLETSTEEAINVPYWLEKPGTKGMYAVSDLQKIGAPENGSAIQAVVYLKINEQELAFDVPVVHKRVDPVKGEVYRPFVFAPAVSVSVKDKIIIFANQESKTVDLTVKSGSSQSSGTINVKFDEGWTVSPSTIPYSFKEKGEELVIPVKVTPSSKQSSTNLSFWLNDQPVF